ncbi:MAG: hypothetical protein N2445_04605 [Acidobacteria bacterium]|nr:hypothetical protein [Acidobacteriota bacterium]
MKYFIDGNNLGLFLFKEKKGADARSAILNFLLTRKIPKASIIVFDGFPFCSESDKGQLSIIFSKKRKADEIILEKIKRGDIIVSNDRELQYKCKTKGAKICDLNTFLSKSEMKIVKSEKPHLENDIEGWMKIFSEGKK